MGGDDGVWYIQMRYEILLIRLVQLVSYVFVDLARGRDA